MEDTKTISLAGSKDINWDMVENRAKELNVTRSKYTQTLYEDDILSKKYKDRKDSVLFFTIAMLFAVVVIQLLIAW